MRLLAKPAAWLRAGATLTPEFAMRNPIRDQFTAAIFSEHGFIPGVDLVRGMFEVAGNTETYQLWRMGGGQHAILVSVDREGNQQTLTDLLRSRIGKAGQFIIHPLRLLQTVSGFMEEATRLGEFKRALAATKDPTQAAFASREVTLDFQRIGAKTRALNAIIAFWNANIQGTDQFIRKHKNSPVATTLKALLYLTLPSVLLYYANRDDGRWEDIPQWQKNTFWIVLPGFISKDDWHNLTPDEKAKRLDLLSSYRIPKPFVVGQIYGSIPERIMEWIDTKKPGLFDEMMKSLSQGATPGFLPTALLPVIENMANHSFFYDRAIVPEAKVDLLPSEQFATYTSDTAKMIGKALNYAPAKVDNLIQGYFAGLGRYAVELLDAIKKGITGEKGVPDPALNLSETPIIRAFVVRDPIGSGSESVNDFYKIYGKADAGKKYYNGLVEAGKDDEAEKYLEQHTEIKFAKELRSIAREISEYTKEKDNIKKDPDLTPEEKRKQIKEIEAAISDIAYNALQMTLDYEQ